MRGLVIGGVLLAGISMSASAAPVLQFDMGAGNQTVAAGWDAVTVSAGGGNALAPYYNNFIRSDNSDEIFLTMNPDSYGDPPDYGGRNYSDAGSNDLPFDNVIDDAVKVDSGHLNLMIESLQAGTYTVTSYHNNTDFGSVSSQNFRVEVQDAANANYTTMANNIAMSQLFDGPVSSATFNLVSNGTDPVRFRFTSNVAQGALALNGFTVSVAAVPEPASLGLLAAAGAAMVAARRRR